MKDENPQTVGITHFVGCIDLVKSLKKVKNCGIIIIERKKEMVKKKS